MKSVAYSKKNKNSDPQNILIYKSDPLLERSLRHPAGTDVCLEDSYFSEYA